MRNGGTVSERRSGATANKPSSWTDAYAKKGSDQDAAERLQVEFYNPATTEARHAQIRRELAANSRTFDKPSRHRELSATLRSAESPIMETVATDAAAAGVEDLCRLLANLADSSDEVIRGRCIEEIYQKSRILTGRKDGVDEAAVKAFAWVSETHNAATRGRRLTAYQIAQNGPAAIAGCASLKVAAELRDMSESMLHVILNQLKADFGIALRGTLRT